MITLMDALNKMDERDRHGEPIPFDIEFVTCDRRRKRGGEIIIMKNAVKSLKRKPSPALAPGQARPAPKHGQNSTRNIQCIGSSQIRKINIRLITKLNGENIVY